MTPKDLEILLEKFRRGEVPADEIVSELRAAPFEDIGFANLDMHRELRQGSAEVVYGESKTAEQILAVCRRLYTPGKRPVLVTRLSASKADVLSEFGEAFFYDKTARIAVIGSLPEKDGRGTVLILTAGTSDDAVAREAELTALALGNDVKRISDVGVAGIERLLAHVRDIQAASVIIAVAGMEGALPTVVSGLTDAPVIAVPTSVGYGAAFDGLAALLSMINSCAGGIGVVNIDNGFGAAVTASRINHLKEGCLAR